MRIINKKCQKGQKFKHIVLAVFITMLLIRVHVSNEWMAAIFSLQLETSVQTHDEYFGLKNCTDKHFESRRIVATSPGNSLSSYVDMPLNHVDPGVRLTRCRPKQTHTILFYNQHAYFDTDVVRAYLKQCVYDNCKLTTDRTDFRAASAVIFHYHYAGLDVTVPPVSRGHRNPDQAWVLFGREPPIERNVQALRNSAWQNTFNWTMTYRLDSDMISAYGGLRTRARTPVKDYDAIFDSKTKMAAWIVSSCRTQGGKEQFVKDLKSHGIQVDVYGRCGSQPEIPAYDALLSGSPEAKILAKYKFYLSLENSNCHDYITEKFFARYDNDLILVARGGADYDKVLPTKTYINAAHFNNTKILAEYMLKLGNDRNAYIEMLRRKDQYEADGPWPFGWRYGFCGLCEKVNDMDQHRKTYSDVHAYLTKDECVISPNITTYKETENIASAAVPFYDITNVLAVLILLLLCY